MKKILPLVLIVVSIFLLVGCESSSTPPNESEPVIQNEGGANEDKNFSKGDWYIGGGDSTGTFYAMANCFAQFYKDIGGLGKFSSYASTGGVQNAVLMQKNEIELGIVGSTAAVEAYNGVGSFEGKPYKGIRSIAYLYPTYIQMFVTEKSGIEKPADFKGSTVCVGAIGSGDNYLHELILESMGLDFNNDIKKEYVQGGEAADKLRDGNADAHATGTQIPNPNFIDLFSSKKVKLFTYTEEMLSYLCDQENSLYFRLTVPAGTYKNQDEDVPIIGNATLLCTRDDMDEDFVYELTKTIYENRERLDPMHAVLSKMDVNWNAQDIGIPLHPGAEKYYREIGVISN